MKTFIQEPLSHKAIERPKADFNFNHGFLESPSRVFTRLANFRQRGLYLCIATYTYNESWIPALQPTRLLTSIVRPLTWWPQTEIRKLETNHTKLYILYARKGVTRAWVGSANFVGTNVLHDILLEVPQRDFEAVNLLWQTLWDLGSTVIQVPQTSGSDATPQP